MFYVNVNHPLSLQILHCIGSHADRVKMDCVGLTEMRRFKGRLLELQVHLRRVWLGNRFMSRPRSRDIGSAFLGKHVSQLAQDTGWLYLTSLSIQTVPWWAYHGIRVMSPSLSLLVWKDHAGQSQQHSEETQWQHSSYSVSRSEPDCPANIWSQHCQWSKLDAQDQSFCGSCYLVSAYWASLYLADIFCSRGHHYYRVLVRMTPGIKPISQYRPRRMIFLSNSLIYPHFIFPRRSTSFYPCIICQYPRAFCFCER